MNSLSSHVLDTTKGQPARHMAITLTTPENITVQSTTDADGRCKDWHDVAFTHGTYTLRFHTGDYLQVTHGEPFYPFVDVHFCMQENGGHYHIPLLISPFGYSSYRGS